MMRTTQPMAVLGMRHAIATLSSTVLSGFSPAGASRRRPVGSCVPNRATRPPKTTRANEIHKVAYAPIRGTVKLASSDPSVGNPPVNANQNQPTAVPRRLGGVTAVIQTRKPYANNG